MDENNNIDGKTSAMSDKREKGTNDYKDNAVMNPDATTMRG